MEYANNVVDVVVALRWVLVAVAFLVLGALYGERVKRCHELEDLVDSLDQENEFLTRRLATARSVRREVVVEFINERPDYVNALEQNGGDLGDKQRWRGNAEARRMLATRLGLSVPHHRGERTEPSTSYARVVNG